MVGPSSHRSGPRKERPRVFLLRFVVLTFLGAGSALGQNTDSLLLENGRKFTVIDQISDPAEREALLKIYRAGGSRARVDLAEAFLKKYPQSWLLAEVYEITAKAYIDLGELDRALPAGRASLAILPESPSLLVLLANAEVKLGERAEGQQSAAAALDLLERFDGPATIPKEKWPEVRQQLQASCYFVLGRVKTLEGLDLAPGEERRSALRESLRQLAHARLLNPHDPEIAYLIGLDDMALGSQTEAARWMLAVYRQGGPMKDRALEKLHTIFVQSGQHQTFEEYLGTLGPPGPLPALEINHQARVNSAPTEYAGSKVCATCHADIYRNWSETGMARMLRPYAAENILGDFTHDNVFYVGDEARAEGEVFKFVSTEKRQPFAHMIVDRGRHYFEILQPDRLWHRYPVNYTIGSKWQQGYVTQLPDGQLQVFPIEYNLRYHRWVNFWKIIDAPGTERDDPRAWESFRPDTNYLMNCAVCHTSQLRNTQGRGFEAENLEFREPGVGCEMCHGPGSRHVAARMRGEDYTKAPLESPVDFARISSADSVAVCSQCHMQSAVRLPGAEGELNYSPGANGFFPRYRSRPYDEFYLNAHFKDGRFESTSFIAESFLRSRCFKKGGATCVSCHDPHGDDAASNPTSLRFRDEPNKMCIQCHGEFANAVNLDRHTRHARNSEGSQCVSCHMPRIMNALMSRARSHQIDEVPNARMTEQFGQDESPNACLICHGGKSTAWLDHQLEAGWNLHSRMSLLNPTLP